MSSRDYGPGWGRIQQEAKDRFAICVSAWAHIRLQAETDREFYAGKQWDDNVESDRLNAGRPCLTINRMQQFIKQVTNEQRKNRPSIQINPVADSTVEDAEVLEGMCRHIQVDSEAEAAYDTASQAQTTHGWGYMRALTEFLPASFDQKIKISRIKDPFKVYPDPYCSELDFSDAKYWFVFDDIPVAEYKKQYPKSAVATMSSYMSTGDSNWFPTQCVRVAEYFWVEEEPYELIKWADGTDHREDQSPPQQIKEAVARRTATERVVHWVKMNAVEPLQGYNEKMAGKVNVGGRKDFSDDGFKIIPGPYIPVVPVLGDEFIVNGRTMYSGMVRFARDAQRQYNYMRTAAVEMIALAPKAPFIMAEGQDENHENDWKEANRRNLSRLLYKPVALGNQLAPPPQRMAVEPPIQAITIAIQQAEHDLMATMGLYQPSLGGIGPEQSGKAIIARQQKGEVANFNYSDNFSRSLRQLGRILLTWIPVYYDVPRIAEIVKLNGDHGVVPINQKYTKGPDGRPIPLPAGADAGSSKINLHNLVNFRGTVTISSGPSYQTKRQEEVASILALVQSAPQIMGVAGDLLVGAMDWHGAREISKRLKAMLPPGVRAMDQADMLSPENVGMLIQQFEALKVEFQKVKTELDTKQPELLIKKYIAELQGEVKLREAQIKAGIVDGQRQADELEMTTNMGHEAGLAAEAAAREDRMQNQQHAHEIALAQGQQGHERQMQAEAPTPTAAA